MNYNIARCSIKWCKNENKRYIIISNHMQRFYHLICQSTWCQNASKLIYQKGEISFLWDIKNLVCCKFDFHAWRWTGRWQKSSGLENRPTPGMVFQKHPVFHFAPMFHFAPTYYIWHLNISEPSVIQFILHSASFFIFILALQAHLCPTLGRIIDYQR